MLTARAAYKLTGNGIVKRYCKTIKTIVKRGYISFSEVLFWYMPPGQDRRRIQCSKKLCLDMSKSINNNL